MSLQGLLYMLIVGELLIDRTRSPSNAHSLGQLLYFIKPNKNCLAGHIILWRPLRLYTTHIWYNQSCEALFWLLNWPRAGERARLHHSQYFLIHKYEHLILLITCNNRPPVPARLDLLIELYLNGLWTEPSMYLQMEDGERSEYEKLREVLWWWQHTLAQKVATQIIIPCSAKKINVTTI